VLSVRAGLIGPPVRLAISGERLALDEALFAQDALVMPDVASRSVRFEALRDGRTLRALEVSWTGYRDLGIWSKPSGADFLCIEPWYGTSSPEGWQGAFDDKPGILHLAPGERRDFLWRAGLTR